MQLSYFGDLLLERFDKCGKAFKVGQLHSFELVGGNTRVPSVISIAEEIFGMSHSRTLNSDECMSEGAAVACAMESPC
jgi:molecular chaperone DnaK (HSP70)